MDDGAVGALGGLPCSQSISSTGCAPLQFPRNFRNRALLGTFPRKFRNRALFMGDHGRFTHVQRRRVTVEPLASSYHAVKRPGPTAKAAWYARFLRCAARALAPLSSRLRDKANARVTASTDLAARTLFATVALDFIHNDPLQLGAAVLAAPQRKWPGQTLMTGRCARVSSPDGRDVPYYQGCPKRDASDSKRCGAVRLGAACCAAA